MYPFTLIDFCINASHIKPIKSLYHSSIWSPEDFCPPAMWRLSTQAVWRLPHASPDTCKDNQLQFFLPAPQAVSGPHNTLWETIWTSQHTWAYRCPQFSSVAAIDRREYDIIPAQRACPIGKYKLCCLAGKAYCWQTMLYRMDCLLLIIINNTFNYLLNTGFWLLLYKKHMYIRLDDCENHWLETSMHYNGYITLVSS